MLSRDSERLTELSRTIREVDVASSRGSPPTHDLDAVERLQRADQDGARVIDGSGHGVHTPVDAVDEVHVRDAWWSVQRRRTLGSAGSGVTGKIVLTDIGLGLDNPARDHSLARAALENGPKQLARDDFRFAREERPR